MNSATTVTALFRGGLRFLAPEGQRTGIYKDPIESAVVTGEGIVGDDQAYRIGDVLAQVSHPRSPCWKINHKFGIQKLSLFIEKQRITGWYYRVLETGKMRVNDRIVLVERPNEGASIARFLDVVRQHRPKLEELDALLGCDGLNQEWAARLKDRRAHIATTL